MLNISLRSFILLAVIKMLEIGGLEYLNKHPSEKPTHVKLCVQSDELKISASTHYGSVTS